METRIAATIEKVLVPLGFQNTTLQNTNVVNCGDNVGQIQIQFLIYNLRNSDYFLEIQLADYKLASTSSTSTVAVNILVLLLCNGVRTFGASKFIDDQNSMKNNIEEMLKIPSDKLINATNPRAKCFAQELIRDKILEYMQPRDAANLEQVSTYFRYELLDSSVDQSFWRKHYLAEYGNNDLDMEQTYRANYHRRKLHARNWLRFASRYSLFIPAFPPTRWRPDRLNPVQPINPRNPFRPNPNIPYPINPIQPNPYNPFRPEPYNPILPEPYNPLQPLHPGIINSLPPLHGDFSLPNQIPGARSIEDPLNMMPGNDGRPGPSGGNRSGRSGGGFFGGSGGGGFGRIV